MRGEIRVLCGAAAATGFGLAGLRPDVAADAGDGARRLAGLLQDDEIGVVLVQEDFYRSLPDAERRRWARRSVPLVVPFPAPGLESGGAGPDGFIAELLRRAVGYRVRLG